MQHPLQFTKHKHFYLKLCGVVYKKLETMEYMSLSRKIIENKNGKKTNKRKDHSSPQYMTYTKPVRMIWTSNNIYTDREPCIIDGEEISDR